MFTEFRGCIIDAYNILSRAKEFSYKTAAIFFFPPSDLEFYNKTSSS